MPLVRRLVLSAALGLFLATPVRAQDQGGLGLDLSAPSPPEPEKKPEKPKEEKPPPPAAGEAKAPVQAQPKADLSEREVMLEDRVKAVQRRSVLKSHRLELSPALGVSVNDPFYTKYSAGVWALFYPHDSLGFGIRAMYLATFATWNVRTAKRALLAALPVSRPVWDVVADVQWTPFYGKIKVRNAIAQFDLFLVGGVGVMASETTFAKDSSVAEMHFATDLGIGMRAMIGDYVAVSLTYLDTVYSDRPGGGNRSQTQNLGLVQFGISFFIPPRFEYEVH
jgi:outer membrane beta-barrel protein